MAKLKRWRDLAPTMGSAAGRLGLPVSVISAVKQAGCAGFIANGAVDTEEVTKFLKDHPDFLKGITGDSSNISKEIEERLKLRAERQMKELKLELARRQTIPAEEIRRTFTRYVVAAKSKTWAGIKTGAQEAGLALGLSSEQMLVIEEKVSGRVRVAFEELARCEWGKLECPKCKEEIKP